MVEPVFSLQMVFHFLRFIWSLPILSTIPVFFFYFLHGRVNIAVCIHSGIVRSVECEVSDSKGKVKPRLLRLVVAAA